jgi:hypothetical protein
MAGIQFWPEVQPIEGHLRVAIENHDQMVVIFTNVIFDTSQSHANVIFRDMFEWLDSLKEIFEKYPETLFIIRAHPDEDRPGKESMQSVAMWIEGSEILENSNVVFLGPSEYVSSYELIRQAKFSLIYNSSIGLEASIMGAPVLCAGKARFTQVPTVFFPGGRAEYLNMLESFLAKTDVENPIEFQENARRFLYFQLFRTSLDFSNFLVTDPDIPGGVLLGDQDINSLNPEVTEEMSIMANGILDGLPFVYDG